MPPRLSGAAKRYARTKRFLLFWFVDLVLAVVGGVVTARLGVVMFGVAGMAVRGVGVMRGLFVVAGLVMLGGFAVMLGGMLVMLGGLVVMIDVGVLAHVALPVRG